MVQPRECSLLLQLRQLIAVLLQAGCARRSLFNSENYTFFQSDCWKDRAGMVAEGDAGESSLGFSPDFPPTLV